MSEIPEPLAHVEIRNGAFVGAISHRLGIPEEEKSWRREVEKFCGETIASGSTITTVYSKDEYQALLKDLPMWTPSKGETR